jgi:hypothetical protein
VLAKTLPTTFAKTNEIKSENVISGSSSTEVSPTILNERIKRFFIAKQNEDVRIECFWLTFCFASFYVGTKFRYFFEGLIKNSCKKISKYLVNVFQFLM